MKVLITHDGTDRELDLGSMKMRESLECQNLTGWTWTEWRANLIDDRAEAVTYAWYLACKRHGDDVDYQSLFDVLDQALISFTVVDDEAKPADKPGELGVSDEGPTGPGPDPAESPN